MLSINTKKNLNHYIKALVVYVDSSSSSKKNTACFLVAFEYIQQPTSVRLITDIFLRQQNFFDLAFVITKSLYGQQR